MERDSNGWELHGYRIVYARSKKKRVKVKMYFNQFAPVTTIPKEVLEIFKTKNINVGNKIETEIEDWSVWEKINGIWYAWETGARTHLILNDEIVPPKNIELDFIK